MTLSSKQINEASDKLCATLTECFLEQSKAFSDIDLRSHVTISLLAYAKSLAILLKGLWKVNPRIGDDEFNSFQEAFAEDVKRYFKKMMEENITCN
jgi:hypothetical protein